MYVIVLKSFLKHFVFPRFGGRPKMGASIKISRQRNRISFYYSLRRRLGLFFLPLSTVCLSVCLSVCPYMLRAHLLLSRRLFVVVVRENGASRKKIEISDAAGSTFAPFLLYFF